MTTTPAYKLIDFNNPVFASYALWAAVLALKMFYMSLHTGFNRFKNQTFANAEDCLDAKRVRFNDEQVERVRRAHRNDMENILPSLIVGLIYVLINPSQFLACTLFKVAGLARILHTIVYAVVRVPQPARALSFAAHFGISIYMGLAIVHKLYW